MKLKDRKDKILVFIFLSNSYKIINGYIKQTDFYEWLFFMDISFVVPKICTPKI